MTSLKGPSDTYHIATLYPDTTGTPGPLKVYQPRLSCWHIAVTTHGTPLSWLLVRRMLIYRSMPDTCCQSDDVAISPAPDSIVTSIQMIEKRLYSERGDTRPIRVGVWWPGGGGGHGAGGIWWPGVVVVGGGGGPILVTGGGRRGYVPVRNGGPWVGGGIVARGTRGYGGPLGVYGGPRAYIGKHYDILYTILILYTPLIFTIL